jgi:hypothetical protein
MIHKLNLSRSRSKDESRQNEQLVDDASSLPHQRSPLTMNKNNGAVEIQRRDIRAEK